MKPEFRGLRDSLKTLTFVAHAFLRILVVLLLTALSASAQLGMRTRNPFYLYPRFGVIGNNPDMAAVLKQKLDPTKQRTLDVEYSAAPSLHLGCDIIPPARRGDRSAGHRALCTTRNARRGERENGARASAKCTWARLRFSSRSIRAAIRITCSVCPVTRKVNR